MVKFWGDKRWGRENGVLDNKIGNISETREDRGKVTMESLKERTNALPNSTTPTPYGLPFFEIGGLQLSYPSYLRNR